MGIGYPPLAGTGLIFPPIASRGLTGTGTGGGRGGYGGVIPGDPRPRCHLELHAAADWGMSQVHIESDSQNLVCALQSSDFDLAPEGVIYRDLRVFMRLHFSSVLITYVPCTCNKLAHALAALGMSRRANRQLWQEALPVELPVTSTIAESRI
jgi:hypothetical protein